MFFPSVSAPSPMGVHLRYIHASPNYCSLTDNDLCMCGAEAGGFQVKNKNSLFLDWIHMWS